MPVDWGTIKPLFVLRADWREQLRSLFVFEERPLLIDHEAWLVKSAAKPREASRSIRTEVLNLLDDHAEDWRELGRNQIARNLAHLGFEEGYARHLVSEWRKGGTKKLAPGRVSRLDDYRSR